MIRTYRLVFTATGDTESTALALCDSHKSRFVVPTGRTLRLIDDRTTRPCWRCEMKPKGKR